MNELILNDRTLQTASPASMTLLDFVRYEKGCRGTKVGCREGDCGACTVLIGALAEGAVIYRSVTSCLAPLGSAFGKHVVTVEGLNMDDLSVVQQAFVDEGATQCGFCTPGFVVSMSGFCLRCEGERDSRQAVAAVDGNICRCTGYQSIRRAAGRVAEALRGVGTVQELVERGFLPVYFLDIPGRLAGLAGTGPIPEEDGAIRVGGGTDLYVQRPGELEGAPVRLLGEEEELKGVAVEDGVCRIGAATTATELLESPEMNRMFPRLREHLELVSSTPIRNMGTLAGNLVNASPIGDFSIFFLALDASLRVCGGDDSGRVIRLRDFFTGYKQLAMEAEEWIHSIEFAVPGPDSRFHFEKVAKRRHLDIASVNTAMQVSLRGEVVEFIHLSAGGVGPVPRYLERTGEALTGEELSVESIGAAARVLEGEISPISDARGSAEYKTLLLRSLFFAHFLELFPERFSLEDWI